MTQERDGKSPDQSHQGNTLRPAFEAFGAVAPSFFPDTLPPQESSNVLKASQDTSGNPVQGRNRTNSRLGIGGNPDMSTQNAVRGPIPGGVRVPERGGTTAEGGKEPRDVSRRKFLGFLAAVGGTLAVGGGIGGFLATRSESSTPAKPTPEGTQPGGVVTTKTPDATKTPVRETATATNTPTPTEIPTPSPTPEPDNLQTAIEKRHIELKEANDWEKYFTPITVEEASQMIEAANSAATSGEELRVLLPFDPTTSPNLIIEPFTANINGADYELLGFNGIEAKNVYAPISGNGDVSIGSSSDGLFQIGIVIRDNKGQSGNIFAFSLAKESAEQDFPQGKDLPVTVGTSMLKVIEPVSVGWYNGQGNYEAKMSLGYQRRQTNTMSLTNLLQKEGKVAFISQQ